MAAWMSLPSVSRLPASGRCCFDPSIPAHSTPTHPPPPPQFLHLNAEKAPFFVQKLALTILPAILVFKDGVKGEQLFGFEDLGGKDDFRTEVRMGGWV